MAMRRPGFWHKSRGEFNKGWYEFSTYKELIKNLPKFIRDNEDKEIHVFRQRRGEWGEWFEIWEMNGDKLVKVKEGWE